MRKSGASFSCLCWRGTRSVVEPNKVVAVKTPRQPLQSECLDIITVRNEPLVSEKRAYCETSKQAASVESKKPFPGPFQKASENPDVTTSMLTETALKDTQDNVNYLLPAASTDPQGATGFFSEQVPTATEIHQTNVESEKPGLDKRQRTSSQETTMAEELKDSSGDDRNDYQETEPCKESIALPHTVVEMRPAASSAAADLVVVDIPEPAAKLASNSEAEKEGVPGAKIEAQPGTHKNQPAEIQVPDVETGANLDTNKTTRLAQKAERSAQQVVMQSHARNEPTSPEKPGSPTQQIDHNSEGHLLHATNKKSHPAAVSCRSTAVVGSQEEEARGEAAGEGSQLAENALNDSATMRVQRKRRKKKASKAKGKRCHGKTGRR